MRFASLWRADEQTNIVMGLLVLALFAQAVLTLRLRRLQVEQRRRREDPDLSS